MTIPSERTRAVRQVRDFLREMLDTKKMPKIPRTIRIRARYLLKHYPSDLDIEQVFDVKGPFGREG